MAVSALHELLVEMFLDHPAAVAGLIGRDGAAARTATSALSTTDVAEQRADAVIVVGEPATEVVIVEVQTSLDREKAAAWSAYIGVASRRWEPPVRLLVLTVDQGLADYYARPLAVGPSVTIQPTVIGPRELKSHVDQHQHADVLTMMAAIANPGDATLGIRALKFATTFDSAAAAGYTDLIIQAASPAVKAYVEKQMRHFDPSKLKTEYAKFIWARFTEAEERGHEQGRKAGHKEGREEGLRSAIYTICSTRGVALDDAHHQRLADASRETLERYLEHALTATDADAIFAPR